MKRSALRRFGSVELKDNIKQIGADHPAVIEKRPLFPKSVVAVADSPRLLVSGHNNRKIGKKILKGDWAGMPVYTLTLAERTTCPRQCFMFERCYGDAMHWARRHEHGPELEQRLTKEVAAKAAQHRNGFAIRLHVLGDFYSAAYARHWLHLLGNYKELHVWGYTARSFQHDHEIALEIARMNARFPERCLIRWSSNRALPGGATVYGARQQAEDANVTVCPAELLQSECCATCGLCWSKNFRDKPIAFIEHGGVKKR